MNHVAKARNLKALRCAQTNCFQFAETLDVSKQIQIHSHVEPIASSLVRVVSYSEPMKSRSYSLEADTKPLGFVLSTWHFQSTNLYFFCCFFHPKYSDPSSTLLGSSSSPIRSSGSSSSSLRYCFSKPPTATARVICS
jgi:hypothetical protein